MATTTLHKFRNFPAEVRLEIWRLFLEDEARGRRVVVWDGRVMPFAHLASPLLRVSPETRPLALERYPTKLDIYSLPKPGEFFPFESDRIAVNRNPVTDLCFRGPEYSLNMLVQSGADRLAPHDLQGAQRLSDDHDMFTIPNSAILAAEARDILDRAELSASVKGALYLNAARDTIVHGHNCGVHFFAPRPIDLLHGDQGKLASPLWRSFSSRVPHTFYQTAVNVLPVVGHHYFADAAETYFPQKIIMSPETGQRLWSPFPFDMDIPHPVLTLRKDERADLMLNIARTPHHLRGDIEVWAHLGKKDDMFVYLTHLPSEIMGSEARYHSFVEHVHRGQAVAKRCCRTKEEYEQEQSEVHDYLLGWKGSLDGMKQLEERERAYWQELWTGADENMVVL